MKRLFFYFVIILSLSDCAWFQKKEPEKKIDFQKIETPEELKEYLVHPSPAVRYQAISVLGGLNALPAKKAELVVGSLRDSEQSVKLKAVDIISVAEYTPATDDLIEIHKNSNLEMKSRTSEALSKMGQKGEKYLFDEAIKEIKEEKKDVKEAFKENNLNIEKVKELLVQSSMEEEEKLKILFSIDPKYAINLILEELDRETDSERFYEKLVGIKDYGVLYSIDYIYENISNPEYRMRNLSVIRYFALQKDSRFLPALEKFSGSPDNEIRRNALSALKIIRGY